MDGNWKKVSLLIVSVCWLAAIAAGTLAMTHYASTPGSESAAPADWPADSTITPAEGMSTLVMFAHPKCPCTQASMGQLDRLIATVEGGVRTYVLFYQPAGAEADWAATRLWEKAEAIPGVTPLLDEDGREARLFGAVTSGHVNLYDARGALQFDGGITQSRGHEGDNIGRTSIVSFLRNGEISQSQAPTFGCPIIRTEPDRR